MSTPSLQNGSPVCAPTAARFPAAITCTHKCSMPGIGKQGAPDCRIPRRPLTPGAPNQLQQCNTVRQWRSMKHGVIEFRIDPA